MATKKKAASSVQDGAQHPLGFVINITGTHGRVDAIGTTVPIDHLIEFAGLVIHHGQATAKELADAIQARLVERWNNDFLNEPLAETYSLAKPASQLKGFELVDLVCLAMIDNWEQSEEWSNCDPDQMREEADSFTGAADGIVDWL